MKEGLLKLSFSIAKWFCISLATVYLGFKWVQKEFKAVAQEEIAHVEDKISKIRAVDMEHLDKRFDRIEKLIKEN